MTAERSKDKFIAYIDILGYKNMLDSSLDGTGMTLTELSELRALLCTPADKSQFVIDGPLICPQSQYLSRNLDFQISQKPGDDGCLMSSEISPAGVINLVRHCSRLVIRLLERGVLCRGYITRGLIHHTNMAHEGPGFDDVLASERRVSAFKHDVADTGTPFVEIAHAVCKYVTRGDDACVKNMFSRLVETDGEVVALFPFKRLVSPFLGSLGPRDVEKEKQTIRISRVMITTMKDRIKSFMNRADEKAMRKCEHYLRALDDQLALCDEAFDDLEAPFPSGNMADIWKTQP
jgi:hypothetical protein